MKNLRCLTDTGLVPIRPITLLVGRNSSGKSTFLRAFPLLRQSVETARNSPVLWYDERYVDFGSLEAAANNRLSEPSVTFQFRLRMPDSVGGTIDVAMTLAGGENPYVSAYEIVGVGYECRWTFDAHRLRELRRLGTGAQIVVETHSESRRPWCLSTCTRRPSGSRMIAAPMLVMESSPDSRRSSAPRPPRKCWPGASRSRPSSPDLRSPHSEGAQVETPAPTMFSPSSCFTSGGDRGPPGV